MKHGKLCTIAHNLADSLASGVSLLIGAYDLDVFGEAASSEGGHITIDFLAGRVTEGEASQSLTHAAERYAETLPEFCAKHGASVGEFAELSATFSSNAIGRYATVMVTDSNGRQSVTDYVGIPLKRPRRLDSRGRIRRAT